MVAVAATTSLPVTFKSLLDAHRRIQSQKGLLKLLYYFSLIIRHIFWLNKKNPVNQLLYFKNLRPIDLHMYRNKIARFQKSIKFGMCSTSGVDRSDLHNEQRNFRCCPAQSVMNTRYITPCLRRKGELTRSFLPIPCGLATAHSLCYSKVDEAISTPSTAITPGHWSQI